MIDFARFHAHYFPSDPFVWGRFFHFLLVEQIDTGGSSAEIERVRLVVSCPNECPAILQSALLRSI